MGFTQPGMAEAEAIRIGESIFRTQAMILGEVNYRLFTGDANTLCETRQYGDLGVLKGASIILGGSLATRGYSGAILRDVSHQRMLQLAGGGDTPDILDSRVDSADAGACGAWHALSSEIRRPWSAAAREVVSRGLTPLLIAVDIGGTKTHLVSVAFGPNGELTNSILQRETFPTPGLEPGAFYESLCRRVADHYSARLPAPYERLRLVVVGQPGRFSQPHGAVEPGTARDLGEFGGVVPAHLIQTALAKYGLSDMEVFVSNDGEAQLGGLLAAWLSQKTPKEIWRNASKPIVYLGVGTGLGFGAARVILLGNGPDEWKFGFIDCPKLGYLPVNRDWLAAVLAECSLEFDWQPLLERVQSWRDILSGRFIRHCTSIVEASALRDNKRVFTSSGPLSLVPDQNLRSAVANSDLREFQGQYLSELLAPYVADHQANAIVDLHRDRLIALTASAVSAMQREIGETLPDNILHYPDDFYAVCRAVHRAHERGQLVHFAGVGKSDAIARHLNYIFNNLGIRCDHLRLTAANAENLTNLRRDDVVFLLSNSGKSPEILSILPSITAKGCTTVAICGCPDSELAMSTQWLLSSYVTQNPVPVPEAPTTSTLAALAMGTAVAIVVSHKIDYSAEQFHNDRPGEVAPCPEAKADPTLDEVAMALETCRQFGSAIGSLTRDSAFGLQVLGLVKRILTADRRGKTVYFTGAGASLDVAEKVAATFTSLGINAFALSALNIPLGDLGHLGSGDLIVFVSYSGETRSLLRIFNDVRSKSIDCALVTASPNSTLAKAISNVVVAGEGLDDDALVPIPAQKILASFVNLAVGDLLAVLIAHLANTTEEAFATSHPGGAIQRLRTQESQDDLRFVSEEQLPLNPRTRESVDSWRSFLRRRDSGIGHEAIVIGMGAVGCGLIGRDLYRRGYATYFVDRDPTRLKAMREFGRYSVQLCSGCGDLSTEVIGRVSSVAHDDHTRIAALALRIDQIFVSVGAGNLNDLGALVASVVRERYRFRVDEPLNIIFVENLPVDDNHLSNLRRLVSRLLGEPDLQVYLDNHVAFVPAIDEALLPEVVDFRRPIRRELNAPPVIIDQSLWKGPTHDRWGPSFKFVSNFAAQHRRKLWGHNLAHAVVAYLGDARGYRMVDEAVRDSEITEYARAAVQRAGAVLYARVELWKEEPLSTYIDNLFARYGNRDLADTVSRVARDPLRKLDTGDRLVGPANYVGQHGRTDPHPILVGIVAAAHYASKTKAVDDLAKLRDQISDRLFIPEAASRIAAAEADFRRFLREHEPVKTSGQSKSA